MFALFGPYQFAAKAGAILLLFLALAGAYFSWRSHERGIGREQAAAEYRSILEAQKNEASRLLDEETARVVVAEQNLRAFLDAKELQYVADQKKVVALGRRLRDLAADNNGRLLDPNADGCRDGSISSKNSNTSYPGTNEGHPPETGRLLSRPLSQLLLAGDDEAEEVNAAYQACWDYAFSLHDELTRFKTKTGGK